MSTLAITPTEAATALPYLVAEAPAGLYNLPYIDIPSDVERLKHLGRGNGSRDVPFIDPRTIRIRKDFNHRDMTTPETRAHVEWLKASIKAAGVKVPLQVEWDDRTPYLVSGECRLRAALELRAEGSDVLVPVMQVSGDEAAILMESMLSNCGKPPSQLEFGEGANKLIALGWSEEKIITLVPPHVGLSGDRAKLLYVKKAVELHNAPLEVKRMVREGVDGVEVSADRAIAETRKSKAGAADRIREAAASAKASGQGIVKRVKAPSAPKDEAKNVSNLVLYAAEEMAKALDVWIVDATAGPEAKLIEAHKAYRKLIRAPKQGEAE